MAAALPPAAALRAEDEDEDDDPYDDDDDDDAPYDDDDEEEEEEDDKEAGGGGRGGAGAPLECVLLEARGETYALFAPAPPGVAVAAALLSKSRPHYERPLLSLVAYAKAYFRVVNDVALTFTPLDLVVHQDSVHARVRCSPGCAPLHGASDPDSVGGWADTHAAAAGAGAPGSAREPGLDARRSNARATALPPGRAGHQLLRALAVPRVADHAC
jgi:hypothetical protein